MKASTVRLPALLLVILSFQTGWVVTSQAQHLDRSRFLRWTYQDAAALVQLPNGDTPFYVLGGTAILASVSLLDKTSGHEMQESYNGPLTSYFDLTNKLGGPNVTAPVAAIFAVSLVTDNERFQDAAFTSLQALVYSGAVTHGLKYAVGRMRPEDIEGPYHFAPFSGHSSFPSGHTSTAFAVLTPWTLYYPHPVTRTLLVVGAGGTALARIARDKHWATDVIAGGSMGFMTAYWLTRRHQQETDFKPGKPHVTLLPSMGPSAPALTLNVRF